MTQVQIRWLTVALGGVALSLLGLRADPIPVATTIVDRGPLAVTMIRAGQARSHHRRVVGAPVPGRLLPIALREGDAIVTGQSIARLQPRPASLRPLSEQRARAVAAGLALRERELEAHRAGIDLELARVEVARLTTLADRQLATRDALAAARGRAMALARAIDIAASRVRAAEVERLDAETALAAARVVAAGGSRAALEVAAPANGQVLHLLAAAGRELDAGEPIAVIGDPLPLEVAVALAPDEARRLEPGMPAWLQIPGRSPRIHALLRRIDEHGIGARDAPDPLPEAVLDLVDDPGTLSDGDTVDAHVVTWAAADVLQVPCAALFRCGADWCVFVDVYGTARRRVVKIGALNMERAQVLAGLEVGTRVVLRPPATLEDGVRVRAAP